MPTKPRSPCRVPRCPRLAVKGGYCEEHQYLAAEQRKRQDERRGSSARRGYGAAWQRLRDLKLRQNPLCEDCLQENPPKVTAATLVHHANPISEGGEALPPLSELVSLCERCHDRRHSQSSK